MTDQALIDRFLAGDRSAFDDLMRAHEGRVFATCLRMMREREAALDAAQETFVTVFRKLDRYSGEAAFTTWLYRVTVNTCYDQLRRARRRMTEPLPEHHDPRDRASDDQLEAAELRPELEEALAGLPDEFRAAVVLSDVEGLSIQQVADILQIPPGTVKSRVFRGRRLLAEQLGNLRGRPAPPIGERHA